MKRLNHTKYLAQAFKHFLFSFLEDSLLRKTLNYNKFLTLKREYISQEHQSSDKPPHTIASNGADKSIQWCWINTLWHVGYSALFSGITSSGLVWPMKMCTIPVNRLEDEACPVKVCLGKLTELDMTPMGWLGCKTSKQTNDPQFAN